MASQTIAYASSVDRAAPLLANVCFQPNGRPKPLLLVMHGYNGSKEHVDTDLRELAEKGVFAVAPDMRGRGGSAGVWDSSGLDVFDIVDAGLAAIGHFPAEIDAASWNIVGYSGGGGNAIAAGCRFPDLFQTAVSFFGIADYAGWHASRGRADCNKTMEGILGSPQDQPARYEARNMVPAAGNARSTRWWLFWDEQETQCPPQACDEPWAAAYRAAGGTSLEVRVSKTTDAKRWLHGYRTNHDSLRAADDLFLRDVLGQPRDLSLPPTGELVVPGYLVTRRFCVFIASPQGDIRGRVRIRYDLAGQSPVVKVIDNPGNLTVKIDYSTVTAWLPKSASR